MSRRRPTRPRCLALTKAGDQCEGYAARGSDYCGAHGPKAGRTTKLTDSLVTALEEQARTGLYRTELARMAGVDERTLYRWLEAGAADDEAGKTTIYTRLRQALTRAEAEAEEAMLAAVRRAGTGVIAYDENGERIDTPPADWRAAAWFLERRFPDKYGNRQRVTVDEGRDAGRPQVISVDGDERRRALVGILERAGALGTDEERDAA